MSTWLSSALVAAVARSAWAPTPQLPAVAPHRPVHHVGVERLVELSGAVVADRPEQRAVLVRAVAGGLEVVVDKLVGAQMQRQVARLLALAGHLDVRDAARDTAVLIGWRGRACL